MPLVWFDGFLRSKDQHKSNINDNGNNINNNFGVRIPKRQ